MAETLMVNEIYLSLQGESTWAGLPCVFIRLTACNLRCSYCDTAYAFTQGSRRTFDEIRQEVRRLSDPFGIVPVAGQRLPLVELTGGEPLLQQGVFPLMKHLCDEGRTVLLETSGAHPISGVDARVRRIMDLKCPSSGEVGRNRWENLPHLTPNDEIKFVMATREDYQWVREMIKLHDLASRCPLLVSWVQPLSPEQQDPSLKSVPVGQTPMSRRELAEWVIKDALPVRLQVQLHKILWNPAQKGV